MMRREAVLDLDPHHRALRRCHGCGSYARPYGEVQGRLLCEKCMEKARRGDSLEEEKLELRGEIEA